MRKVKQLKGWGIYENNSREVEEFGFSFTVLHPDNMRYVYVCTPQDTDMECNSLEEAVNWVQNF